MVDSLVQREVSLSATFHQKRASGGPIGLIKDGDEVTIDLINRTLNVNQTKEELNHRKEALQPFKAKSEIRLSGKIYCFGH